MPPPKDPEKYLQWKEKISRTCKEKGVGKWMKDKPAFFLGKSHSKETKEKLSKVFKVIAEEKGFGKWMKGKHASPLTKEKLSKARKGKTYEEIYGDRAEVEKTKRLVSNRAKWFGKPRKYRPKQEGNPKYIQWRKAVFERDDYTCQQCDMRGGYLQAHHIEAWSKNPLLRFEIDNGITFCFDCHKLIEKLERLK